MLGIFVIYIHCLCILYGLSSVLWQCIAWSKSGVSKIQPVEPYHQAHGATSVSQTGPMHCIWCPCHTSPKWWIQAWLGSGPQTNPVHQFQYAAYTPDQFSAGLVWDACCIWCSCQPSPVCCLWHMGPDEFDPPGLNYAWN